ncbi:MAG: glycine cleavage system aminomethyltransferase GcvT [Rhodospirillaceae bacterium]|nr:glycine cleavage system aminomethyltransferase GcvT [Rhodospirillaceae bacterium]MBT5241231.1 glycine cleavage system aminomethyltransferase GcvT [Rhodospirillaceae bacterium]MBT5565134.1 glycine cleavage system aminomethyltransferase GcvT [Rhodospirillaceae bacterium]MBT6088156.1 glycine cleavage system aminomethyltransferase GcvT [Rhodospirillaceae bacterium]
MPDSATLDALLTTPLDGLHQSLGAKMVPFAGYSMPVQYPLGVLKEHLHTRAAAGLFDVSHMGQADLVGDNIAEALERLVPGELQALKPGRIRYTQLLNDSGGIIDDLMIAKPVDGDPNRVHLVVNAACKDKDYAVLQAGLPDASLERKNDHALLALQGPQAAAVLSRFDPLCSSMPFMSLRPTTIDGADVVISRCGYTGEDGFEISIAAADAETFARTLIEQPEVEPIGLGARDSLRLESGLCLYGHDMDDDTSPIEADLTWSIGKRRRAEGGFPGDARILKELHEGPSRLRVGLKPVGRAPAREGAVIEVPDGAAVGVVTSGGFGPTAEGPIAMGYVAVEYAKPGTRLHLIVRGKALEADVVAMPFVSQRYYRGSK